MKILITGASGFIGRHLLSRLSGHHELVTVVRDKRQAQANQTARVVVMDLARRLDATALPSEVDVIIHLAQANVSWPENANELFAVNMSATQQLLDYGRRAGARQFILASTGDVYGRHDGWSQESDVAQPASYYAVTKYAAELLAQAYASYMQPCLIRLFQPYGPGQADRLIPKLAERIRQQQAVLLHRDDRPRLTPIYIDDVTCAIERAIDLVYAGVVNLAGDRAVSMRELAEAIGGALGHEPVFAETGEASADLMGDNRLMKQIFGDWEMIALADGLARMFNGEEAALWQNRV